MHDPKTLWFDTADGLTLCGDEYGDPKQPTVLLAHGGGQTRHSWAGTARALAENRWHAVSLDLRGHGDSQWAPDGNYGFAVFADDLRCVAASLDKPAVIGASLGGIAAMLAEATQNSFTSMVLVDIAPRIRREGAERILQFMTAHMEHGFASLEEAAQVVANYLPHRRRPTSTDGLIKNLRRGEDGRLRWHWDPAFIRQDRTSIEEGGRQLYDAAKALRLPCLLVRGQDSDVVDEESVREFLDLVPYAKYRDVSRAGHMVAGDHNDAFSAAAIEFLDGQRGGS